METRREALAKVGLAKPGRGKFSREAMAWLDKARESGQKFSDDNKPTGNPVARVVNQKSEGAPSKEAPSGIPEYVFPSDYRFPEDEYRAYYFAGGKKVKVSLRECCKSCKVSFTNHSCQSPVFSVLNKDMPITIEKG